ncbi:hypothetical protein [Tardiphaga sp. OK245]|uniref:hypothetical protein n=1 Tax=Tardiphaga sp. OK245 TaxID=1855306 RepID=UPI001114ACA4|nr:hypothetical protein [Tardiphaga sp. OK245]
MAGASNAAEGYSARNRSRTGPYRTAIIPTALSHQEFFADPRRAVAPEHRREMIGSNQPVRYEALITYRALDAVGAVIQEQASCTFNSLSGGDAPNKTGWVLIDGEYNLDWVKRQNPNSRERFFRILKNS